jgi:predicted protein tyrosine phosphatase
MSTLNRIANCGNRFQGDYRRVLCVCSAGLLRSPTAAFVLSQEPFHFNTRAVGISQEYALVPLDSVHLTWADEVVTFEKEHTAEVKRVLEGAYREDRDLLIHQLNIPDQFEYRDPRLVKLIKERYVAATNFK